MSSEGTVTATELRERLVRKAAVDEEFRARLLADPKAVVKDELGLTIPDGFTIQVHEERGDTGHLVLPPPAWLAEADLEAAAGGGTTSTSCREEGSIWTGYRTVCQTTYTPDQSTHDYPDDWTTPDGS